MRHSPIELRLLRCCKDWGIANFTVFAFSTENWSRSAVEVNFLMQLFERLLDSQLEQMHSEGVRIRFIGDRSQVPIALQAMMDKSIDKTADNQAVTFNPDLLRGMPSSQTSHQH